MARIVVTGASGFIGTRLVERLHDLGHDVTCMLHVHEPSGERFRDHQVVRANVCDPMTLKGQFDRCDVVYHLAGCTIARFPDEFNQVNRDGTVNVAEACAAAETPPKLLFVSSMAAIGPAVDGRPLSESEEPNPVSAYGRSKRQAEQRLEHMSDRLPIQIVRPPSVFGDSDPYLRGLFKLAKNGFVAIPGSTPQHYSMIHLSDAVEAIIHVASREDVRVSGNSQGVVHLAQDPPLTFAEFAKIVRGNFSKGDVRVLHLPKSLCWTVAGLNSLAARILPIRPLLNLDKIREGMGGSWMVDSSLLTGPLGFEFPFTLEERIQETAEGYHQKGSI